MEDCVGSEYRVKGKSRTESDREEDCVKDCVVLSDTVHGYRTGQVTNPVLAPVLGDSSSLTNEHLCCLRLPSHRLSMKFVLNSASQRTVRS